MRSDEVRRLQQFLNTHGFVLASGTELGAPGYETDLFGLLTEDAVKRFQAAYAAEILAPVGLTAPSGFFGPSSHRTGTFHRRQGATILKRTSSQLAAKNYFVAYTCQKVHSAWKCGCRDSACTTAYWQLRGLRSNRSSVRVRFFGPSSIRKANALLGA